MRFSFIFFILVASACATKPLRELATVPAVSFQGQVSVRLDEALKYGPGATLPYLKTHMEPRGFDGLNGKNIHQILPVALRAERASGVPAEKNTQHRFISKFRKWNFEHKRKRASAILANFDCSAALETQALAYTMELDFPEQEAMALAQSLHEKILVCQSSPVQESLFKLTIFSIQRKDCQRATSYLNQFPNTPERGVRDRIAYLQGFCAQNAAVKSRNPWGGYGILLKSQDEFDSKDTWSLSARSGSEDWDRLLSTLVQLYEKADIDSIRAIATKLNYENFRTLPQDYQAAVLVLFNFSGLDLPIFQTLHKYLSEHPEKASASVTQLLFPIRYWEKITEYSKTADPVLVKALIRQESAFNPLARSRARAAGLMQLIYPTAKNFGVKRPAELLVPETNIQAGAEFLSRLISEFGSVELALAAYNAGPGMVRQWQKRYPTDNIDLFVEMIPYTETREYVRLVKRNYRIYQSLLVKPQVLGLLDSRP